MNELFRDFDWARDELLVGVLIGMTACVLLSAGTSRLALAVRRRRWAAQSRAIDARGRVVEILAVPPDQADAMQWENPRLWTPRQCRSLLFDNATDGGIKEAAYFGFCARLGLSAVARPGMAYLALVEKTPEADA